jgi:glycosyltransferase involved in cell wall biosynthesis
VDSAKALEAESGAPQRKRFVSVFFHRSSVHSELALVKYVRQARPEWDLQIVTAPNHVKTSEEFIERWKLERTQVHAMPVVRLPGFAAHAIGCYLRPFAPWPIPDPQPDYVFAWLQPFVPHAWQLAARVRHWKSDPVLTFTLEQNIRLSMEGVWRFFGRGAYRRCDWCAALGPEHRDVGRLAGYQGPVEYGLLGYDPDLLGPDAEAGREARSELGIEDFLILYVGGVERSKGVFTLLEAFRRLRKEGVKATLLLLGDGRDYNALSVRAREMGLARDVLLPGKVPHTRLRGYLNAADVMVVPSELRQESNDRPWLRIPWKEQFGRVVVEGMACGCPVVGSDSGEIPRLIGREDMIFQSERPDELYATLRRVQASPELRQEVGAYNLERVQRYRLDNIARAICDNMEKYEALKSASRG